GPSEAGSDPETSGPDQPFSIPHLNRLESRCPTREHDFAECRRVQSGPVRIFVIRSFRSCVLGAWQCVARSGCVSPVSRSRLSAACGRVGCSSRLHGYRYSQRSFANNRGSRYVPDELVVAPAKRVWSWNCLRTRGRFYDTDV